MKVHVIARTFAFVKRVTVNLKFPCWHSVRSDAGTYRRKESMSLPHHDELLVNMVNEGIGEELGGVAAAFAIQLKVTLAAG